MSATNLETITQPPAPVLRPYITGYAGFHVSGLPRRTLSGLQDYELAGRDPCASGVGK